MTTKTQSQVLNFTARSGTVRNDPKPIRLNNRGTFLRAPRTWSVPLRKTLSIKFSFNRFHLTLDLDLADEPWVGSFKST